MSKSMRKYLKMIVPPILTDVLNNYFQASQLPESGWFGNYSSWEEASAECSGYHSEIILEKVRSSALKVKNGEAVFERDSVVFNRIDYSFPLLTCLMWIAAQNKGKLNIIDFGGSLGSTYFQNYQLLKCLDELSWNIIEQPNFVSVGKKEFETHQLKFFTSIESCLEGDKPRAILLSGVLQYLEKPHDFLKNLICYNFEYIIVNRTSFIDDTKDKLTIQNIPEKIYSGSYPSWFFNFQHFMKVFENKYEIMFEFDDSLTQKTLLNEKYGYWKGIFLKKK
jgi:putative methyltransferase (TIGR04325 family)